MVNSGKTGCDSILTQDHLLVLLIHRGYGYMMILLLKQPELGWLLFKWVYADRESWWFICGKFQSGTDDTGLILKFWEKSSYPKWELFQQYFYLYLSAIKAGSVYIGMSSILRGEHDCCILACISSSGANIGAKEKSSIENSTKEH